MLGLPHVVLVLTMPSNPTVPSTSMYVPTAEAMAGGQAGLRSVLLNSAL